MTKYIITLLVGLVIGAGAVAVYVKYTTPPASFGSSTQGSTGQTAKQYNVYGVNLANPGANGTSTSILNSTGNDLYVSGIKIGCENVGTSKTAYTGAALAALNINIGTTSVAAPASVDYFAGVTGTALAMGTGTVDLLISSSTLLTATSSYAAIWNAGSYMTFFTNATNTAVCTFGVDAFTS